MRSDTLKQVLPFLIVFYLIKINSARHAPSDIPKPFVSVKVHQAPNWVLPHHPFQGSCATSLQAGETLNLRIVSQPVADIDYPETIAEYEFGNNSRVHIRTKLDSMVVKQLGDTVVNDTRLIMRAVVFKICPTARIHRSHIHCYSADATRSHFRFRQHTELLKLRIMHSRPIFKMGYHILPNIGIKGENLTVSCSAKVGTNGSLVISMTTLIKKYEWTVGWDEMDSMIDHPGYETQMSYYKEMVDGVPRIDAQLSILVTFELSGSIFHCYSKDESGNPRYFGEEAVKEATSAPLAVSDIPYRPHITMSSVIDDAKHYFPVWTVRGSCEAPKEHADSLTLIFHSDQWTFSIAINDSRHSHEKQYRDDTIQKRNTLMRTWFKRIPDPAEVSLIAEFYAEMRVEAMAATAACVVQNIQLCKTIKVEHALLHRKPPRMESLITHLSLFYIGFVLVLVSNAFSVAMFLAWRGTRRQSVEKEQPQQTQETGE